MKSSSLNSVANLILPNGWVEKSNGADSSSARIWFLWNPRVVYVQVLHKNAQFMHCDVKYKNAMFELTACYGYNNYMQRRDL